jgi:diguanylate cyclase (GGDEF)-like protein
MVDGESQLSGSRIAGTDLVLVADVGPANWLALDCFHAFAKGADDACLRHIASNEALARAFGDDATAWRCRDVMVSALAAAGRMQESLAVAEDLMRHYKEAGQSASRLQILGQTISARFARGDFNTALDELTEALVGLSRLRECNRASAAAFLTVANAASAAELFEMAASQLRRAADLAGKVNIAFLSRMVDGSVARNELRLAAGLEMIGRPADAAARYREALRAAVRAQAGEPTGHWRRIGRLYEGFAWTSLGEPELGRVALLEALGRDEAPMDHEDALILRLGLARACAALDRADEGRAHLHLTAGRVDATFSHIWQVAVVLEAVEVERLEHGDHPGIGIAKYASVVLANSLWEERERRLEAVMVRMQMLELAEENERFGQAVTEDALTQLGNRRRLDWALAELTDDAMGPVSVLFLDLDNFKQVNDVFSHAIGDQVLKTVADLLRRETREGDVLVRYGGDEFVVVLRATELPAAVVVGERIRAAVATYPWWRLAHGLDATISVGVADHRPAMSYDAVMSAADTALHQAKDLGRDQVAVA